MQNVLTPQGSRAIDQWCIQNGTSAAELMAVASASAAAAVRTLVPAGTPIVVACGGGNNGGDGFSMALDLSADYPVTVISDADPATMSPEAAAYARRAYSELSCCPWSDIDHLNPQSAVIDALVGVGGTSMLRDPLPERLRSLHRFSGRHIAVDVPTGVDALTGRVHPEAFRADVTITMEGPKSGFFSAAARAVVGTVVVVGIGAPARVVQSTAIAQIIEDADVPALLPTRDLRANKFTRGCVVVIGGSRSMRGAPSMTAEAAMRVGAGLAILATPSVHPLTPREVMTCVLPSSPEGWMDPSAEPLLLSEVERASAVAIGPGLGKEPAVLAMIARVVNQLDPALPVVVDADGLRMIPQLNRDLTNVVLTPHEGEYQRLLRDLGIADPEHQQPAYLAMQLGCVVHRKGIPSVTTNGQQAVWTVRGNPGMATAGSGDVLTGIIAGLAAQGLSTYRAASLGSFLHAAAGDLAARELSEYGMLAGDVISRVGRILTTSGAVQ
ncbi:MAG: NAD(P)H-hydrate dehydratase [Candidatus Kapaibacteriota bacterium]